MDEPAFFDVNAGFCFETWNVIQYVMFTCRPLIGMDYALLIGSLVKEAARIEEWKKRCFNKLCRCDLIRMVFKSCNQKTLAYRRSGRSQ